MINPGIAFVGQVHVQDGACVDPVAPGRSFLGEQRLPELAMKPLQ